MVAANGGLDGVSKWSQFYFVPGKGHCGGGPGLDQFDFLGAIVNWVEKGKTPTFVIATGKGFPGRSRPLCPYPSTPTIRVKATRRMQATSNAVDIRRQRKLRLIGRPVQPFNGRTYRPGSLCPIV